MEFIRDVFPLPHSPWMPTVIGVLVSVIKSINDSVCTLISRLSLDPGATGSSIIPTILKF